MNPPPLARHAIVVVPFPYADQLAQKRRPALVISTPDFHKRTGLAWVAMITSSKNPRWDNDCEIADLKSCGLPAPSVVRPAKIATIDLGRIIGTLGHLPISEAKAVRAFITQSLA